MKKSTVEYLKRCHKKSLKSGEDVQALLVQARRGDRRAKDRLLRANLELAALLALRLRPNEITKERAIQVGVATLGAMIDEGNEEVLVLLAARIDRALKKAATQPQFKEQVRRGGESGIRAL